MAIGTKDLKPKGKQTETPAERMTEQAVEEGTHNPAPSDPRRTALEAEQPAIQAAKALEEGDEERAREALHGNTQGFVDPEKK